MNIYLPRGQKHGELFTSYERSTDRNVLAEKKEYRRLVFQEPTLPDYFMNIQKMQYMYYHLNLYTYHNDKFDNNVTKFLLED